MALSYLREPRALNPYSEAAADARESLRSRPELLRELRFRILSGMFADVLLSVILFTQEPTVELPPELDRVLTDYENAWSARDAKALAALFAEDGFVLASGRPPVRGRAAIESHYQGHGGPLSLRAIACATEGSVGFILGGYASEKGKDDDGKFTLTLRKDSSGKWWIFSDMDNGNRRSP